MNSFTPPEDPRLFEIAEELHAKLACGDELTKRFITVCLREVQLFDYKQRNYGPKNIAAFGAYGVLVRLHDKVARLINLEKTKGDPKDETKDDTWGDIGVYAKIATMCRWGWWPDVEPALGHDLRYTPAKAPKAGFTIIELMMVGVVACIVAAFLAPTARNWMRPCVASHVARVHHDARTTFIVYPAGKVMITTPVYHDAYDADETICDRRAAR